MSVKTEPSENKELSPKPIIMTPKEMVAYMDKFVIGQQQAKKTLAVAMYNHYKRSLMNIHGISPIEELNDVVIDKSNVLLAGHTGTGKTYMLKTMAQAIGLPCYIADATKLTESGYVGDDVENILVGLLRECDYNIQVAQMGIVVIDEIDKLGRKSDNPSITRDVGGEGVQQGLLKIVEGGIVGVPPQGGRKHPEQSLIYLDTTNILFIGMGAFDGLDMIIRRRLNLNSVGFISNGHQQMEDESDILSDVQPDDLKSFGLIPELIGRFPTFAYTNDLSTEDLKRILTEPKNSLVKQYRKLFLMDGVDLLIEDKALDVVANRAMDLKTGARGLRTIMEKILNELMYEYSGEDLAAVAVNVDADMVERILKTKTRLVNRSVA